MPSTMIHLLCADNIHPNSPLEYYIGTFAPDAIAVRENYNFKQKDKLHFRNLPNPLEDIAKFAREIDISNPYCEGYVIHLFLDTYWDKDCMKPFKEKVGNMSWVREYKMQISATSSAIYYSDKKLSKIWDDMTKYETPINYNIQGVKNDEINTYYGYNKLWFEHFKKKEPTLYPVDFTYEYCEKVAKEYKEWVKRI